MAGDAAKDNESDDYYQKGKAWGERTARLFHRTSRLTVKFPNLNEPDTRPEVLLKIVNHLLSDPEDSVAHRFIEEHFTPTNPNSAAEVFADGQVGRFFQGAAEGIQTRE